MVDLASPTQGLVYEEHFDMSQKLIESSVRMATVERETDRNSNPSNSKRDQRILGPGSRTSRALSSSAKR